MSGTITQRGGARLGVFNASWPFATLSATPETLRLTCLSRVYDFRRNQIRRLSRYRGMFSVGLRIDHSNTTFPEFMVFWASLFFWTSGFRKLKTRLEGLGYEIRD